MQYNSQHKPTTLNLDKSFADLSPTESYYLLNHEVLLNVRGLNGNNMGKGKPLPANSQACDINQPGGETYTIGGYRSPLTNELYSWHYNSNGAHYVLRTSNNGCEMVYHGCLDLSAEPKHAIEQFRAYMAIEKICNNRDGKQLIWTNGDSAIGQLDTEASIATKFFTTPFFNRCPDPCAYVQMCVPEICGCIQAEFIPLEQTDIGLPNYILDAPFQFAVKHVYYDLRESEWSDRSTVYYQNAKGCFDTSAGFSRCIKLRVPIGNPMVDKIKIGFTTGLRNETGALIWYIAETVEKYKKYNNTQQKWYERELAELTNYSDDDCSFDYIFCNDKGRQAIDPKEMSRVRNPIPRKPQGILPVKDSLGFFNYEDGNCPVDEIEVEKFDIGINCDSLQGACTPQYVNVTVRAVIHNTRDDLNQFVYRQEGDADDPDDVADTAYFGGIHFGIVANQNIGFGQQFKDKTRNFIGYVDATEFWAEAKQWKSSPGFITRSEVGVLSGMDKNATRVAAVNLIHNGIYYFQEFKIRVRKGTKGFLRLTSQNSVDGSGNAQNKSTSVVGIISNMTSYSGTMDIFTILDQSQKEIYFDACDGDVVLTEAFIISDLAVDSNNTAYTGYISDANGMPVEGAEIYKEGIDLVSTTDHNGFYNFYSDVQGMTAQIRVELTCLSAFSTTQTMSMQGTEGALQEHDEVITSEVYKDDFYLIVKEKVEDCNGTGVSGVRVSVSGSKYKVTTSDGIATFNLRNYINRNRQVQTVVIDSGGCIAMDCSDNCNPCMPTNTEAAPSCFSNTPTLTMPDLVINSASALNTNNGLKSGGRYGYGIVAKANCGKLSAVYDVKYINVPKTQEKGRLNFCNFTYNGNGISLPGWDCLNIVRTINLNPFQLQWKIDKIEKTTDSKIKLTIQSLNDYNTNYFNQTNTVYQWLKGDRVEFIMNGDGSILTTAQHGLLNYLTISPFNDELISGITDDANFFNQLLIEDDGKLDDITEGAIIELQRPPANTTENIYYQICATVPIKDDGRLLYETGTFSTFDTFLVNRSIGSFTGTFEHHSPSDFWGDRVSDAGKAFVVNPYENERRFGRNISINSPTQFNYFGDLVKRFDAPQQGDIIAMDIKDGKIILAICENDNFLAESADDLVRVGGDGIIRALPPDAIISDAQPKIYGAYGCQYDHIGSIYFGDGYAVFFDITKNAFVKHDYSLAKDVGEGRVQTYFRVRGQDIEAYNKITTDPLNKFRFCTGFNTQTGVLAQTIKRLRDSGYNNELAPFKVNNSTMLYHPIIDDFLGFASFTPECYGNLDLYNETGCAFISFLNGIPYIHPIISDKFNEFYGIACDSVIGITLNSNPTKMKIPLALEIESEMAWFAKEVVNDKSGFVSEIPVVRFARNNRKYNASFLYNKNSRSGLYGNNGGVPEDCRGFFTKILLIKDNTDGGRYNTIDNNKRLVYNELGSVLLKYSFVEQTGFQNNL